MSTNTSPLQSMPSRFLPLGWTGTLRYACLMSIFASNMPHPLFIISAITSSTEMYDRVAKSLHTPSFTLWPSGNDKSRIMLALFFFRMTPKGLHWIPSSFATSGAPILPLLDAPQPISYSSHGRPGWLVPHGSQHRSPALFPFEYNWQATCQGGLPAAAAIL